MPATSSSDRAVLDFLALRRLRQAGALPLCATDLEAIDTGFDRRGPESPWCGFAPLSARHVRQPAPTPDAVLRVALFTTAEGTRRLALGRRPDGTYQLADEHGTTVRQSPDLACLLADLSEPKSAH